MTIYNYIRQLLHRQLLILQARSKEDAESDEEDEHTHQEESPKPNPKLAAGCKLPPSLEDYFQNEHIGRPLEDIDEFYQNKRVYYCLF